jgi:hypothetical protein
MKVKFIFKARPSPPPYVKGTSREDLSEGGRRSTDMTME